MATCASLLLGAVWSECWQNGNSTGTWKRVEGGNGLNIFDEILGVKRISATVLGGQSSAKQAIWKKKSMFYYRGLLLDLEECLPLGPWRNSQNPAALALLANREVCSSFGRPLCASC